MKHLSGRLMLLITAVIVVLLCLFRFFLSALYAGIAGVLLALALALFRHGSSRLEDTAQKAEKELHKNGQESHRRS